MLKYQLILIRYGEIALKSKQVRKRMERQLEINIQRHLSHLQMPIKVECLPLTGRIFVHAPNIQPILEILRNVLGIVSYSPCIQTGSSLEEIKLESLQLAEQLLKPEDSFAIRVRRAGKHNFTSQDVAIAVGEHLLTSLKARNIHVNLTNPKKTIYIEVRSRSTYLFTDVFKGIGGFPFKTQEKLIALLIGDYNLATIAAFLMMRRGCEIIPLFIEKNSKQEGNKWKSYLASLKRFIPLPQMEFYSLPQNSRDSGLTQFDLLGLLIRQADFLADQINAIGLVIPFHASSTVPINLEVLKLINEGKQIPRFFPLLGITPGQVKDLEQLLSLPQKGLHVPIVQTSGLNDNFKSSKLPELMQESEFRLIKSHF